MRITPELALILEIFVGFLMGKYAISHSAKLSILVFQQAGPVFELSYNTVF